MRTTLAVIGVLIALLAVTWAIQGNDFFMYKVFAPKYAAVQREVFTNTPSYVQGTTQELQNMQFEYVKADSAHKDALASIILRRAAAIDNKLLPQDLQSFIEKLKSERDGSR